MTYEDYIKNPMGKKNAVFSQRDMYYDFYSKKFDTVMVRENGKMDFKQFVDKKHDKYYIYFKIPSEVIANFYYDVVVEFYPDSPVSKGVQHLHSYNVRFFSNDPSFVFTFAHAFIKNDVFIKELTPKMSKQAVKEPAKEKNPKEEVGYVKSLFFAWFIIKKRGLLNKNSFLGVPDMNFKQLIPQIMDADQKIFLRQQAKVEYDKMAKAEKRKEQNKDKETDDIKDIVERRAKADSLVNVVKKARTTKSVNKVAAIKRTHKK